MSVRRRMRRLERDAAEVMSRRGSGAEALGRKAAAFLVAVALRTDYEGRLADPMRREARYRERLAGFGLEFVDDYDRTNVERLAGEVRWLSPGRRAHGKSRT